MDVPEELKELADSLPCPLYVVGGTCRDALAGLPGDTKEYDICAPVPLEVFAPAAERLGFRPRAVYSATGTEKFTRGGRSYEYACFRTEGYVRGHTPDRIAVTDDIYEDALRRDFTFDAVYYDVSGERFVDPLGRGMRDIRDGLCVCTRDAVRVFSDDGLRLMRMCRLCAETGFSPSRETMEGAVGNAAKIDEIVPERIWAELDALLRSDERHGISSGPAEGCRLLYGTGVMERIVPGFLGPVTEWNEKYSRMGCVAASPPDLRVAALVFDSVLFTLRRDRGDGRPDSASEAGSVARAAFCRVKAPSSVRSECVGLISACMKHDLSAMSEGETVAFVQEHGARAEKIVALLEARSVEEGRHGEFLSLEKERYLGTLARMRENSIPADLKGLDVRGDELIAAGVPERECAAALRMLLRACGEGLVGNEKKALTDYAARTYGGNARTR